MNVNLQKTNAVDGKLTVEVVEADYKDKVAAKLK